MGIQEVFDVEDRWMDVERKKYDVCKAGLGRHAEDRGDGDPV